MTRHHVVIFAAVVSAAFVNLTPAMAQREGGGMYGAGGSAGASATTSGRVSAPAVRGARSQSMGRGNFVATNNGRNAGFVRSDTNTMREARSAGGRDYRGGNLRGDWRDRRGRNFARGFGFGFGAGAYYGGDYDDGYYADGGPYAYDYGDDVYGAPVYAEGDDVQYCMQRFRSYDPQSGTYLGYDGERHPCP